MVIRLLADRNDDKTIKNEKFKNTSFFWVHCRTCVIVNIVVVMQKKNLQRPKRLLKK